MKKDNLLHVTIWIKPSEWDKIQYDWASSGYRYVSGYVINKLLNYKGVPTKRKNDRTEGGCIKSLCFEKDKWAIVKERAEKCDMKISQYVVSILME